MKCNKCKIGKLFQPKDVIGYVVCSNKDCDNKVYIEGGC